MIAQTDAVVVVAVRAQPTGPPGVSPSRLLGIDRTTGQQLWDDDSVEFGDNFGMGVARGPAALDGNTVAIPTRSALTAFDVETGKVLWDVAPLDAPVGAEGVFVGVEPRPFDPGARPVAMLRAIDAATGTDLWSEPGDAFCGAVLPIGDGIVVATSYDERDIPGVARTTSPPGHSAGAMMGSRPRCPVGRR